MSLTNYAARAILNSLMGKTSTFGALATPPGGAGGMWAALATTAPAEGGTFTEASGAGYARVQIAPATWNNATLADPSVIDNASLISFPQATGIWSAGGNMLAVVLMDAATSGNAILVHTLVVPKPVLQDDTFTLPIGNLTASLD